jgi:hypothetical protein
VARPQHLTSSRSLELLSAGAERSTQGAPSAAAELVQARSYFFKDANTPSGFEKHGRPDPSTTSGSSRALPSDDSRPSRQ